MTELTLQTHDLPEHFGWAEFAVKASSHEAYRRLAERLVDHYAENLFNAHWGEQLVFHEDGVHVSMVCQGLDDERAKSVWTPFLDWIRASPADFTFIDAPQIGAGPARRWWDINTNPGLVRDPRAEAATQHGWWRGDGDQASLFVHGYDSQWLPATLLEPAKRGQLAHALMEAAQFQAVEPHVNKGLAGAPDGGERAGTSVRHESESCRRVRPDDCGCGRSAAVCGGPITPPSMTEAHRQAGGVAKAAAVLRALAPQSGFYLSETDFFRGDWREAFWGANYARLKAIKDRYDPDGFFFVHHGVGSEDWSSDGFTPVRS